MRAAIILAAGASRRFGPRDKLKDARASGAWRILLVTSGPISARDVSRVPARNARSGLSASLAAGLAALRPIEREALIFLADMPFARAPRLRLGPGMEAIRPAFRGQPGHPMLVRARIAKDRLGKGDTGLGRALRTAFVPGSPGHVFDVDTIAALRIARRQASRAAHVMTARAG
ncbi:MAG: NTP transferase domain-containing protein [Sphingomonas sp.]|nr:NTP transferase domain-containing protein [Sphingomonas sp.]